jgi:hypothetical protein
MEQTFRWKSVECNIWSGSEFMKVCSGGQERVNGVGRGRGEWKDRRET